MPPLITNHGCRWRYALSWEKEPGTHRIGSWVIPRNGRYVLERKNINPAGGWTSDRPAYGVTVILKNILCHIIPLFICQTRRPQSVLVRWPIGTFMRSLRAKIHKTLSLPCSKETVLIDCGVSPLPPTHYIYIYICIYILFVHTHTHTRTHTPHHTLQPVLKNQNRGLEVPTASKDCRI